MTTLKELKDIDSAIKWQSATVGTLEYFGVPMIDGIMFYIPSAVPAQVAVKQVRDMVEKGMVTL